MSRNFYSEELVTKVCNRIAEGESLRTISLDEDMPSVGAFLNWVAKSDAGDPQYAGLKEHYARSLEQRTEFHAEELIDIADDATNDYVEGERGVRFNPEAVMRAKLRIETRKWLMGKMKPKKYGEKVVQEHTGPNGGPIVSANVTLTAEEAKAINASLENEC